MKNLLLFIILQLFNFNAFTQNRSEENSELKSEFNPNSIELSFFENKKAIDGGVFNTPKGKTYKIKNTIIQKSLFILKSGKFIKHGVFYDCNRISGKLSTKTTYSYGQKHGPYYSYINDSTVQFFKTYSNDTLHGPAKQYHQDAGPSGLTF